MNELFWKHEYLTLKEVEIPKMIAGFIEELKKEIGYIETINYYTQAGVHCIPIKTLEEQFDRVITDLEARRKE